MNNRTNTFFSNKYSWRVVVKMPINLSEQTNSTTKVNRKQGIYDLKTDKVKNKTTAFFLTKIVGGRRVVKLLINLTKQQTCTMSRLMKIEVPKFYIRTRKLFRLLKNIYFDICG